MRIPVGIRINAMNEVRGYVGFIKWQLWALLLQDAGLDFPSPGQLAWFPIPGTIFFLADQVLCPIRELLGTAK